MAAEPADVSRDLVLQQYRGIPGAPREYQVPRRRHRQGPIRARSERLRPPGGPPREPDSREPSAEGALGVERTIEGRHVRLLNFRRGAEDVRTFVDLARLRQREAGLVVAPHPFFPLPSCLHGCLNRQAPLFDAVEINAMFTPVVNFNRFAERWAARHGKPLVGNGDVHRLRQLGLTYSLVDADADPDAICAAIVAGGG